MTVLSTGIAAGEPASAPGSISRKICHSAFSTRGGRRADDLDPAHAARKTADHDQVTAPASAPPSGRTPNAHGRASCPEYVETACDRRSPAGVSGACPDGARPACGHALGLARPLRRAAGRALRGAEALGVGLRRPERTPWSRRVDGWPSSAGRSSHGGGAYLTNASMSSADSPQISACGPAQLRGSALPRMRLAGRPRRGVQFTQESGPDRRSTV